MKIDPHHKMHRVPAFSFYKKTLILLYSIRIGMSKYFFDYLPLWATYLGVAVIIVLSIYAGIRFSRWRKAHVVGEDDSPINTLVGATLGLLAFMLAFTFGLTSSRFESKKHFQLEELNSIETTYLRTDLVSEPYSSELKKALKEYVGIRIYFIENPHDVKKAFKEAQNIQSRIWTQVTELSKADPDNAKTNALLINSVNEMFDYQSRRVAIGLIDRIPGLIWIALFVLILLSMFEVGYLLGKMEKPNWILIIALSLAFTAVIIIIVDLDSSKGLIQIDHNQVYNLYQSMN